MNTKIESIIVKDLDGNSIDLISEYKNEPILLILYNNSCLGCTGRAIPLAYKYQQENPGLKVAGIHSNFVGSVGTKENIKAIFTSGETAFPIFIDEEHKVYDYFKSEGTPQWVLINRKGELHRSIFGSLEDSQHRLLYAIETLQYEDE